MSRFIGIELCIKKQNILYFIEFYVTTLLKKFSFVIKQHNVDANLISTKQRKADEEPFNLQR